MKNTHWFFEAFWKYWQIIVIQGITSPSHNQNILFKKFQKSKSLPLLIILALLFAFFTPPISAYFSAYF